MDTADYYRELGLRSDASLEAVKASYRRLARLYHPDVNPNEEAREKFMAVTEAYKFLLTVAKSQPEVVQWYRPPQSSSFSKQEVSSTPDQPDFSPHQSPQVKVTCKEAAVQRNPKLSEAEQKLKENSYLELQQLLKYQRFPRAIALIEGLAQRLPQDLEVRQWQAIAYQRWGRQLIKDKQLDKARSYLKKALKTDPHNRALWAEVERDFRQMEKIY